MADRARELLMVQEAMPAKVAGVGGSGLLLLPYIHLVPLAARETGVACGAVRVELRQPGGGAIRVAGEVRDAVLPFHVHCRVLVVQAAKAQAPPGTTAWLLE